MISQNEVLVSGKTTYKPYSFSTGKTTWTVIVASGQYNYVLIRKPSPWITAGIEFKNMDAAVAHYKNPTMKMNLRLIENM